MLLHRDRRYSACPGAGQSTEGYGSVGGFFFVPCDTAGIHNDGTAVQFGWSVSDRCGTVSTKPYCVCYRNRSFTYRDNGSLLRNGAIGLLHAANFIQQGLLEKIQFKQPLSFRYSSCPINRFGILPKFTARTAARISSLRLWASGRSHTTSLRSYGPLRK